MSCQDFMDFIFIPSSEGSVFPLKTSAEALQKQGMEVICFVLEKASDVYIFGKFLTPKS